MPVPFSPTLTDEAIAATVADWFALPTPGQLRDYDADLPGAPATPDTIGAWLASNGRCQTGHASSGAVDVDGPAGTVAEALRLAFGDMCLIDDAEQVALFSVPVDGGREVVVEAWVPNDGAGTLRGKRVLVTLERPVGRVEVLPFEPSPAFVAVIGWVVPDGVEALRVAVEALRAELVRLLVYVRSGLVATRRGV